MGVLTASAIGFVVLMGIVESMGNISKSVRKGNQAVSVMELRKDIMGIAMKNTTHSNEESACTNTLKGVKTNGLSADQDTNMHTYTFPEEGSFKKAGLPPGTDSGYKVYKNDSNDSDVYFGSLIINQMRFEKTGLPDPAPTTNFITTTGKLYITFLDKNKSYIQFEDLTPLVVEDIVYNSGDNETIESCNFKLDARTVVECYKVQNNGLSLVGCDSTQAIPIAQTTAYGFGIAGGSLTGAYNSFFGYETAKNNTSGANNSLFGYQAGYTNIAGNNNSFFGYKVGYKNTASDNSFFGHETAFNNTTGTRNSIFGRSAGKMIASGNDNSFFGHQAGFGHQTGTTATTAKKNTFVGSSAGYKNITGNESVLVGYRAGYENTKNANTFVGAFSGYHNRAGNNSFFGYSAGYKNTTGTPNIFIGHSAGLNNTSGNENVFIGNQTGEKNKTGKRNIFLGHQAGAENENGQNNIFIGHRAGKANLSTDNYFIGHFAGHDTTSGKYNLFMGHVAGYKNTTGKQNVILGHYAGTDHKTGQANTYVGDSSGGQGNNSSYNTMIGKGSGAAIVGNDNTFLGFQSGHWIGRGRKNIMIGFEASFGNVPTACPNPCPSLGVGNNNIFIGHKVGSPNHDNEIRIGNTDHTELLLGGDSMEKVQIASEHWNNSTLRELKIGNLIHIKKASSEIKIGDNSFTNVEVGGINLAGLTSSKTLKKNIMPWTDYEMALKDIMEMPLSIYQYKDSHPDHTRRGFIAEDLPEHMQLPTEEDSDLVKPDWATIWGSFWASLKTLAIKFGALKEEVSNKFAELAGHLSDLKNNLADLTKNFSLFQEEMEKTTSDLKAENEELKRELAETKQEVADIKAMLKKQEAMLKEIMNKE